MEILFDNPLANLYGPYFLLLYGFVIFFATVGLLLFKSSFDKSDKLPTPSIPAVLDPFEIAYLRGGENELARAAVFALIRKGVAKLAGEGMTATLAPSVPEAPQSLSDVERSAATWIGTSRRPSDLFGAAGLAGHLSSYSQYYKRRLEAAQLLVDPSRQRTWRAMTFVVSAAILGLGVYKLAAALIHGHRNVLFLVVFLIVGLLAMAFVGRVPRVTKLGQQYIDRLRTAFGSLAVAPDPSMTPMNAQAGAATIDPMLLSVGVFGTAALAGTMFDGYRRTFPHAADGVSGSGSCSSGCGSDIGGSSCSGGDGGGGGGCGGGCGGCGGG